MKSTVKPGLDMSGYDEDERYMPPAYGVDNRDNASKSDRKDDSSEETESEPGCKMWLQVLPSKGGMLLAVLLAEIMTEGMTPDQMNILGNFVSAVGSLISYKASREDI